MVVLESSLTIDAIESRLGVKFSKELIEYMSPRRQELEYDGVDAGKWYCSASPFVLMCGDKETATMIYKHLEPLLKDFKEELSISVSCWC